jgi:hypothetical protein
VADLKKVQLLHDPVISSNPKHIFFWWQQKLPIKFVTLSCGAKLSLLITPSINGVCSSRHCLLVSSHCYWLGASGEKKRSHQMQHLPCDFKLARRVIPIRLVNL